jgi:hypothetical protein
MSLSPRPQYDHPNNVGCNLHYVQCMGVREQNELGKIDIQDFMKSYVFHKHPS